MGYMTNTFIALLCTCLPVLALAESPYALHGLRTGGMSFAEARALAQRLGGECQPAAAATAPPGVTARCEYLPCTQRTAAGECFAWDAAQPVLVQGGQAIVAISLEAAGEDVPLDRIVALYEGDPDAVARELARAYGAPDSGAGEADAPSWTHTRRLGWVSGRHRMALLESPHLIILATEALSQEPAPAIAPAE